MQPTKIHLLAMGMFLTALGVQIGGLQHGWHDALTPTFVSGVILSIGSIIVALATGNLFKNGSSINNGEKK